MTEPDLRATHLADQHNAARADARDQALALAVDIPPGTRASVAVVRMSPWLQEHVDRHNQLVAAGAGYACCHLTGPNDPTVVHLAVWAPGYLACTDCTEAGIFAALTEARLYRCDPCGAIAGHDPCSGAYQVGNLIFHYRLCRSCLDADV